MSRLGKILWLLCGLSLVSFAVVKGLLGGWVPFLWVALALAAVSMVAAFVVDIKFYSEFWSLRTTRQGLNMGTTVILVLVILVAFNIFGSKYYKTWDFSINRVNTLSEQSIQLAKSLKDDLKVIYFYQEGAEGVQENKRAFIELLRKYQDVTNKIKLEFVEVNERPDLAKKYDITRGSHTVVMEYQGRKNTIEKIDEQEITGALSKVTREKEKKVVFLTGHGEVTLDADPTGRSLSALKTLLEGNRYRVESLNLIQNAQIPAETDVLVIWGPQNQFMDFEVKLIGDYLKSGGSLLLALEPNKKHELGSLLKTLGIKESGKNVVPALDLPIGRVIQKTPVPAMDFPEGSSVTRPFPKGEMVVLLFPQPLTREGGEIQEAQYNELIKTGRQSSAFPNLDFSTKEEPGPFTLAYEIRGKWPGGEKPFQAIVLGDEDVFTNRLLYQNLNRDLALNAIAALSKEENLISISPKEIQATRMNITPTHFMVWLFSLVIPLPVLFYILSGVQWFRRRNA